MEWGCPTLEASCDENKRGVNLHQSELQFIHHFHFCSFLYLFLCLSSSVLDKGPSGLKVLVPNKYQCKKKPFTAV